MSQVDKDRCKKYYGENRLSILLRKKEYAKEKGFNSPGFYKSRSEARRLINLKSWEGFIPLETQCQMCGVDIYFNSKNRRFAIHFDHRHGEKHPPRSPHQFIISGPRTPKREALWKSFDFGMLCMTCNLKMPTENRIQFIKNAIRYMQLKECP